MKTTTRNVIKQGRNTMTMTSTTDPERGIETRKFEFRRGRKVNRAEVEIDLATGKPLPPKSTIAGSEMLAIELQEVLLRYSEEAIKKNAPTHDDSAN